MNEPKQLIHGFVVVLVGLGAVVFIFGVAIWRWTDAAEVASVVGTAGGLIGTLVGTFFGLHAGAVGKDKAEKQRDLAEERAREFAAITPPDKYEALRAARPDIFGPPNARHAGPADIADRS